MAKRRPIPAVAALALMLARPALAQTTTPPTTGQPSQPSAAGAVQGLVVTAQRPKAQALIDRQVFTVSGNLQSTTGSAADVLNEVPSVDVDVDGNVTLRGDPNVTILVDGKPSAQFTGPNAGLSLQQLPASEIDRVEVMTNPPAQYKAEGSAGVINIITKKTRRPGVSGIARASVGNDGRYILGVDGAYNNGPLKLSLGGGFRRDVRERLSASDRTETDLGTGVETASHEGIDEHFHRQTFSAKGALDYDLDPRETIGGSFSRDELTGHRFFDQTDAGGPPGAPIATDTTRHSDGHEWHVDASEEAHFSQKLWRPEETLNLRLQRSWTRERESYQYRNTAVLPPGPDTFDDLHLSNDIVADEFAADYELPLPGKRDIKLGYDLEEDINAFDNRGDSIDPVTGALTVDPNTTNQFRYRQRIDALYGSFESPLGPWTLQAGLRAELARVSFLLLTGDIPGGRRDFAVYPSLHLDRSLGDADKLSLGIGRRVTRPDPEALNPFADHQDTHNLRAGNPNLVPQDTWTAEFGYAHDGSGLTYGAKIYYRIDRDSFTTIEQPLSAGVVLITQANLPISRSAGLDFNLDGKLGRQLSYEVSGTAFYAQIDATQLGFPGLKSTAGVNLKASLEYRPTALDTAQISLSRTDRRLTPQGFVSPLDLVNLGYRRQLRPDLAVVATVSDVFDGQKFQRLTTATGLRDAYLRFQVGRIAYLGLVYTFGAQAKVKPAAFEYDQP